MTKSPYSRIIFFFLAVILFGSIVLIAHKVQAGETTTVIEEVDSDGNVGIGTAIAVNNAGQIVIAYFDATNFALKLAVCEDRNCTGNPDIVTVDNNGDVGTSPNIAIAQDDRPVISYFDTTNGDLKLAVCDDPYCTNANLQVVDSAGNVGVNNDLTLDNNGRPVISYYDATNQQLKLAQCNNLNCTAPNLTVVDNFGHPGIFSSVEVDENGRVVVAYYEDTNGDLMIALCNNASCGAPTIKKLDAINNAGMFASLEIVAGRIFVSYFRTNGAGIDLKVARCNDPNCTAVTVLHMIDMNAALYNSMVMNDKGELFISFWDATKSDLIVAACIVDPTDGCNGATFTRVDHFFSTGQYPDIALDNEGMPVISYHDQDDQALNLASCPLCRVPTRNDIGPAAPWDSISLVTGQNGNPIMTYQDIGDNNFYLVYCQDPVCDNFEKTSIGGNLHINPSMALQQNGRPAIAYYHGVTNELKYTVCNNADCTDKTTNVIAFDGYDPSLQFNSDGLAVIAFYNATTNSLNLARCNDIECSAPLLSTVDNAADVGRFTSMQLTPEDYPVISYYDFTNDTIKFAICDDEACTAPAIDKTQLTDGPYNALALSDNGKLFIAFYNNGGQALNILKCNIPCNGWGIGVLDNTSIDTGWDISIVMSQDDKPIVSYYDSEIGGLRLATCHWQSCSFGTSLSVIDTVGGDTGRFTEIVLNNQGEPVIAYTNQTTPSARVLVYEPNLYQVYAPVIIGN